MKDGKSQRSVSAIFKIPKSTVANIWKQRVKIESHVLSSDCPARKDALLGKVDDDIVAAVLDTPTERDSESDNEAETQCPVSHAEACSAFETALK